jgi:hypothetical protein
MATANRPYGRTLNGHTVPYGALVGASKELKSAYYNYGYLRDEDIPELPCIPMMEGEHVDPIEELYKKELIAGVQEVLETLTPRAIKVLQMRFGIGLTQDYTLEEVGRTFEVTRERIRQIESKAIRHIKHPLRSVKLRELFGYYVTTAAKKAEMEAKQTEWEKERARAEEQREARAQFKINSKLREEQRVREEEQRIQEEDKKLRAKWDELYPMVSDTDWVEHLKTENPEMYQELKYMVGDIWGKNARQIWDMHTTEKK